MATKQSDDKITREKLEAEGWSISKFLPMLGHGGKKIIEPDYDFQIHKPIIDTKSITINVKERKNQLGGITTIAGAVFTITTMTELKQIEDFIKRFK